MKKDNKLVKLTTFVLLITIVAISLVSGTYAKYTTTITGSDTVTVAKWDVSFEGETAGTDVEFDLFSTVSDTNVEAGLIAPGTSGSFDLDIVNNSEVTAEYTIDFTVSGATVPLQFKVGEAEEWSDELEDIGTATALPEGASKVTVQWQWPFEGDNAADTALGIAAGDVTVKASLTATQVD